MVKREARLSWSVTETHLWGATREIKSKQTSYVYVSPRVLLLFLLGKHWSKESTTQKYFKLLKGKKKVINYFLSSGLFYWRKKRSPNFQIIRREFFYYFIKNLLTQNETSEPMLNSEAKCESRKFSPSPGSVSTHFSRRFQLHITPADLFLVFSQVWLLHIRRGMHHLPGLY